MAIEEVLLGLFQSAIESEQTLERIEAKIDGTQISKLEGVILSLEQAHRAKKEGKVFLEQLLGSINETTNYFNNQRKKASEGRLQFRNMSENEVINEFLNKGKILLLLITDIAKLLVGNRNNLESAECVGHQQELYFMRFYLISQITKIHILKKIPYSKSQIREEYELFCYMQDRAIILTIRAGHWILPRAFFRSILPKDILNADQNTLNKEFGGLIQKKSMPGRHSIPQQTVFGFHLRKKQLKSTTAELLEMAKFLNELNGPGFLKDLGYSKTPSELLKNIKGMGEIDIDTLTFNFEE